MLYNPNSEHSIYKMIEKGHGRIETREVRVVGDLEWLPQKALCKKLTSLVEVKATREQSGKCESATRLYICSRQSAAIDFSHWVRGHWSVENNCHWEVNVIFGEDAVQMDVGQSAENLGIFRRLAMNMAVIADPERGCRLCRKEMRI